MIVACALDVRPSLLLSVFLIVYLVSREPILKRLITLMGIQ